MTTPSDTTPATPSPVATEGGSLADKVKGKAKEVAGAVIGDDALRAEGELHEAKAAAADDAAELAGDAQQKQAEADLTRREREAAAERQRVAAESDAEAARSRIETAEQAELAAADRDKAAQERAAEDTLRQQEAAADKRGFDAARVHATEVAEADETAQRAGRLRLAARLSAAADAAGGPSGPLGRVRALPRAAVSTYLSALRLPLDAASRRRGDDAAPWGPGLAFDRFDARVRGLAGRLLRDDVLLEQARREQVGTERLEEAADVQAEAAAARKRADAKLASARKAVAAEKQQVEQAAETRKRDIGATTAKRKQAAGSRAAKAKADADQAAETRRVAVERAARSGTAEALKEEQEALSAERAALTRAEDVVRLDDAVDASKEARASR